jgi:hypothetical protein
MGLFVAADTFASAPSFSVYAADNSSKVRTWVVGTGGAYEDVDLGGPVLGEGRWYNVNLGLDAVNGVIDVVVTDIAARTRVLDVTRVVPSWGGLAVDGQFDSLAFFDGELALASPYDAHLVYFDNLMVADNPIPITAAVPEPSTLGLFALAVLGLARIRRAA